MGKSNYVVYIQYIVFKYIHLNTHTPLHASYNITKKLCIVTIKWNSVEDGKKLVLRFRYDFDHLNYIPVNFFRKMEQFDRYIICPANSLVCIGLILRYQQLIGESIVWALLTKNVMNSLIDYHVRIVINLTPREQSLMQNNWRRVSRLWGLVNPFSL